MVRDVRGLEWPFIRCQKLGLSGEIYRVVLDSPETDRGLYVLLVRLYVIAMLNNMLCCWCDALSSSKMDCWFVISPCELILVLLL